MFEDAAKKYDVPVNVVMALGNQESNYNPKAIGTVTQWGRAKGMMQYLDSTAEGGRINPFDPAQSIDYAAKQIRDRLDKGSSMEDAVKEHFAGPDRKLWGAKTQVYGREVMARAGQIGDLFMGGAASTQSNVRTPASNPDPALQAQLDAQEPGRYRVMSDDDTNKSLSTQTMDRDVYGDTFQRINPTAPPSALANALNQWDADNKNRQAKPGAMPSPNPRFDVGIPDLEARLKNMPEPAENGILGNIGDIGRNLKIGSNIAAQDLRELVSKIPFVGKGIVSGLDSVDQSISGQKSDVLLKRDTARMTNSMTPAMQEAMDKKWYDADKGKLGDAWTDWRSYSSGLLQSLPEQAMTMGPSMLLAKAAFAGNVARGASVAVASKAAARTAMISGSLSEGALGGAQSSREVRDKINELGYPVLNQSDAFKALLANGMTPEQAKSQLADDSATRAFITAGVATGIFGGMGDRAIAKLFTEAVGGSVVKRSLRGFGLGALGEGVAEELPQSALQQVAQNEAIRQANPNQSLSEDVVNQALGGLAIGGLQGGAMGGIAAGRNRHGEALAAPQDQAAPAPAAQGPAPAAPVSPTPAQAAGPMSAAVETAAGKSNQVVGDDGKVYQFNIGENGVTMAEAPPSGPMTAALEKTAAKHVLEAKPAPVPAEQAAADSVEAAPAEAAPVPKANNEPAPKPEALDTDVVAKDVKSASSAPVADLTSMDMPELRDRLKYIVNQAKGSGWDKRLMTERRRVEKEINERTTNPVVPVQPTTADTSPNLTSIPTQADANSTMLKAAESTGVPHEVVERQAKGKTVYDVRPISEPAATKRDAGPTAAAKPVADDLVNAAATTAAPANAALKPRLPESIVAGPMGYATTPIGKRVFHETSPEKAARLFETDNANHAPGYYTDKFFVADNPDIALGQGGNRGVRIEYDGDAVSGVEHKKPGTGDIAGREYVTNGLAPRSIVSIDVAADANFAPRMFRKELARDFTKTERPDGSIRYVRHGVESTEAVPATPAAEIPNAHAGKWFGSQEKAESYITKKKIGDTHVVDQTGKVRFEIKPAPNHVDIAAQEAALHPDNNLAEPTQAQKDAGNYKMGHATVHGMDISIENPRGSVRSGTRPDGTTWSHEMSDHYGYVKGTVGNDGDHVDVYVGPNPDSNKVFVVDQMHQKDGSFDEHKAMLGFDSKEQAVAAYASNFDKGWKVGNVTEMSVDRFREWSKDGEATKKPAAESPRSGEYTLKSGERARVIEGASRGQFIVSVGNAIGENMEKSGSFNMSDDGATSRVKARADWAMGNVNDATEQFSNEYAQKEKAAVQGETGATNPQAQIDRSGKPLNIGDKVRMADGSEVEIAKFGRPADGGPFAYDAEGSRIARANRLEKIESTAAQPANDAGPAKNPPPAANQEQFAGNKVFTQDKVNAARARLKSKLNQLNSGVDPEMMMDGLTLAGAHLESGVRKFADYAKAMTDDFGDAIKPYLLSFYEAARHFPGVETDGMSTPKVAEAQHTAMMVEAAEVAKPAAGADTGSKEIKNDTRPTAQNAEGSPEGQATGSIRPDADQRNAAKVPEQPNLFGDGIDRPGTPAGDQRGNDRGAAGLRGESAVTPANAEQRVQDSGGSGAAPGNRADREPASAVGRNYRIAPGELAREGSWAQTADRNLDVVDLIKKLETEKRKPTDAERAQMAKFTGWGASEIANGIFPNQYGNYKSDAWRARGERLKALLTPEEYEAARRTTQYAHYTSEGVIRSIYAGLDRLGFKGGTMVEPGMGTGSFAGLMPDHIAANSHYTGIEYDPITAAIAKALYPQSNITHGDFTKTALPKDFFDAAIGNPPFSGTLVLNDPEYKSQRPMLHDYFFMKTLDRVKPGGLLVFVTSKGTMDKTSDKSRSYLAERANLLGAIRLPQTAFQANAGTEVVTDVIFLQKRGEGIPDNGVQWMNTAPVKAGDQTTNVNEYFAAHPEMVLGEHALTSSQYRANEYTVTPRAGSDIETDFAKAIENLPENVSRPPRGSLAERAVVQDRDFNPKHKKEGGLYVGDDGNLMQVEDGSGVRLDHRIGADGKKIAMTPKQKKWLGDYVTVRDALKQAQFDQLNDGPWEASLKFLNDAYEAFTKANGPILGYTLIERTNPDGTTSETKRYKNEPLLRMDAEGALAYALEKVKEDGTIVKGVALTERVLKRPAQAEIKTTNDALFVSLNRTGALNVEDVAALAGTDHETVLRDLGTAVYEAPGGQWQLADEYTSGNVLKKLKEAQAAAKIDKRFARNVEALLAVQPKPLGPTDISVRLGANWVPPSDIQNFAKEVLEQRADVTYSHLTGQWNVTPYGRQINEWNTDKVSAGAALDSILNNRQIKVTWRDSEGKTHTDLEATEKANDVAAKMKDAFRSWIWKDADRSGRLVQHYNDNFNNIAPRQFDGAHLTLPGMTARFVPHAHQKRAVWRTIQQGDTYLAHAVGAGKTAEMIMAGMEERRLGLSQKPTYVVPNHMLAQFSREFLELYPAANIMVADENNFHTHNRKRFIAQAALNNPDAIVITHSAFGRVGMSDEFTTKFIKNQISEWQSALADADSQGRVTVKQIEKRIEGLEKKLEGKQGKDKKDQVMTFEELGADRLFVDEFHEFRKLDFPTNQGNIKGIDPNGSQKSLDLFMKVQYLREKALAEGKTQPRVLVGASGTPVTNTMGELYTAQRFFQPKQLEEDGLTSFDAWASQYGDVASGFEQNAAGGYEMVSRFAKFVNVPELMRRVRSFMDILTGSNLGALVQRPDVETGSRQIVVTPAPVGYKEYQKTLEARIKKIRETKGKPTKGADIILKVIGDGRFSAIDMRFVDPKLPSDPGSKLNKVLDDVIADYHATADNEYHTDNKTDPLKGASQLVFSDIGLGEQSAISRGFDMREWMEHRLTEAGIPKDHIAFMRDYKQSAKKERMFADMREGKRRILIGGKEMETGVNVQKRLFKMYHIDAPWFPASVEQREGRIVRQGNQNPEVAINAYATKGSYDSTMWGMNARKARFIEQAMNGDDTVRSLDDVSEASAFEMAAALASGDERFMRLAGLKAEVEKMERLRSAHYDEQRELQRNQHYATDRIERNEALIEDLNKAIAKRQPVVAGEFSGKVGKDIFDSREEFSMALFDEFKRLGDSHTDTEQTLATVGGFPVKFYGVERKGSGFSADLHVDIPGDPHPILAYPIDPGVAINGLATRALNQINGMDRAVQEAKGTVLSSQRTLDQISKRVGAAFPEEQILMEKVSEMEHLQAELASENPNVEVSPEALAATPKDAVAPDAEEPRYSVAADGAVAGEFGPVHDEFANKPAAAITRLMSDKTGEAVNAVNRPDLGEISLVYGTDAYGLKHIADRRGVDFVKHIPDLLRNGEVYTKPGQVGRVFIGDNTNEATIRLDWSGDAKTWLVSAYEKYPSGAVANAPGSGGAPKSQRSAIVMQRTEDIGKEGMRLPELNSALRTGELGGVIGSLIDSGKISLYTTAKKLPSNLRGASGIQAVTAKDGSIHMVSNTLTADRAQAVLLHEMFHSSVKSLVGNEQWSNLQGRLGSLYRQGEQSSGKAREFWDKGRARVEEAKKQGGVSTKYEVEEFGAYAIEEYESAPATVRKWVDDLIGHVKAWLVQRFGIQAGQVTPAQLRALSAAALRSNAAPLTGTDGPKFSVAPAATQEAAQPESLTPPEQGLLRRVQAVVQDNMNRVKQVQDRIEKLTGSKDLGYADYYGAETNRPGRVAARLEDMEHKLTKPLMDNLAKSGFTQDQLGELLHAQHAQERNERVAAINEEMPDGGSGMTTADANGILAKYAKDKELHKIANQARGITRATLDMKLEYGLITQEDHDTLAAAYENYVPLKGDGEYGPKVKRAMGHEGRDEHILENIARDYSQAVVSGERNLARQSLLAMVLQNPDSALWTVGVPPKGRYIAGRVFNVVHNGETVGSYTSRSQVDAFMEAKGKDAVNYEVLDSNGDQVKEFTKPLQNNEVMVHVAGEPVRIQIKDDVLARQLRPLDRGQMNVVLKKMHGMNRYFSKIYTGYNPAFILRNAARDAMTGTINMVGSEGALTAAKAWAKYPQAALALGRWAATGKTPAGQTGVYLTEYRMEGGKTGASWMSDLEQQGKTLTRLYEDAYGAGGYLKDGKVGRAAKVAGRKIIGGMAHVVEVANQATENGLRLALYMQLREEGARPSIAAQAAKGVTVNFDRKGTATGTLGALYLFVNPAIQGTANAAKTLTKSEHKAQAWAALSLLPMLGLFAATSGMDDDKDRWLGRNWDARTKNFIYHVGTHEIRVPMSQEYTPFYAAGITIGESLRGESAMSSAARVMSSFLDAYIPLQGMFSADSDNHGADLGLSLVPTIAQPVARSIANRNNQGFQIVPENDFTKDRPDNLKMYRSTKNSAYDGAAQGIAAAGQKLGAGAYENDVSKISPETLKMLWATYTGGLGTFLTDSAGLAKMGVTDSGGIESGNVPIVKDFWRPDTVAPVRSRFYDLAKDAKAAAFELKQAKKAGDDSAMDKILRDPSKAELLSLDKLTKATARASAKLRDEAVDVNADKSLSPVEKRTQLKALEAEEEAVLREGISAFK